MKNLILLLFCLAATQSFAQTAEQFDGPAWKPPYNLSMDGWGIERFPIPIDFAPEIAYKGVEDIRFTKGWGDIKNPEYWSYAFAWCLDGSPIITTDSIVRNLNLYYDGLIARNIAKRNIPAAMVFKTRTTLKKVAPVGADNATFEGTISMLDYMGKKPMKLNVTVHLKKCGTKTILFHQLSPQAASSSVWKNLQSLWTNFACNE